MNKFSEWLSERDKKLAENLWGNIPVNGRKPSDGPQTKPTLSSNQSNKMGGMPGTASPIQGKMKK